MRVLTKDVGGSFGIKVHTYADEMATVALSKLLKRPVKFVADRIESFVTDIHARDHRIKAKIGVKNDGTITAFEIDDLTGIGPYSVYPRTSGIEANQVVNLTGGPYTCPNYRAQARVVFQNKNVMCQYRAVGHPIAVAVTEGLVDLAAAKIGMDPLEIRRRNLIADDAYPCTAAVRHEVREAVAPRVARPSRHDDELRRPARRAGEAARARHLSRHRLCELHRGDQSVRRVLRRRRRAHLLAGRRHRASSTRKARSSCTPASPSRARAPKPCSRNASPRRSACRSTRCASSPATPTTRPMAAAPGPRAPPASAAKRPGRPARRCAATCWRSRGAILQAKPETLDIRNGIVVDKRHGTERLPLDELARVAYFRPDTLPPGFQAELMATRHYVPRAWPFAFTNGIQASYLEVDTDTGFVKLLKHWCVEDCGTIINPQLVDEQIRGGVVQGIGARAVRAMPL